MTPANFYKPETFEADETLGFLLRRCVVLMSQAVERRMEPEGLTNAQGIALLMLYLARASTVAELARACDIDAGATTRLVDRMEMKRLIRRERSSVDRRVVKVALTEKGLALGAKFPVLLSELLNESLSGFSAKEWDTLMLLVRHVLGNLESMEKRQDPRPLHLSVNHDK